MLVGGKSQKKESRDLFNSMKTAATISIAICFLSGLAYAQEKNVTKGNQQWVQYYNQTRLSDKWTLLVDGGYRWKQDLGKRFQYIIRAAGGYNIRPGIRVAAGFAHLGTYTDIDITVVEFRTHQELTIKQDLLGPGLNHRVRIEQRFIEATKNNDEQFDRSNWRFRYRFLFSIPIIGNFPNHNHRSLRLNVGDEIFINAGKDIVYNVFDQNRILIGPAFQFNKNLTFTFIYSGKFTALNLPSEYTYNHIFWLGIRHRLDLTKTSGKP